MTAVALERNSPASPVIVNSLDWIYVAKGIGIFLVVVGHFSAYPAPSPPYWNELVRLIYTFHMPLFFMLSGYLYSYGKYSYLEFLRVKTKRLLYPFASIAAIFLLVKLATGAFANLAHPVEFESLYALLTNPIQSFVPLLWFVHALFFVFAIYPLMRMVANEWTVLAILVVLDALGAGEILIIGNALAYGPFFVLGVMLRQGQLQAVLRGSLLSRTLIPAVLFVSVYIASFVLGSIPEDSYAVRLCLGTFGSLAVIHLSQRLDELGNRTVIRVVIDLGFYSMGIYLFHTLFESGVRIGSFQVLRNDQLPFELVACVAIAAGLVCPVILEKRVLRQFALTRKLILGLS